MKTLPQSGEDSEEVLAAWAACFKAGVEYMKEHASTADPENPREKAVGEGG